MFALQQISIRPAFPSLAVSQLLTLQVIRRALSHDVADSPEAIAWRDVGVSLRLAHAHMMQCQHVGLVVGIDGAVLLTRHEKRLLRATAAAQIPDRALVDNLIFALAPGRALRPYLTEAIDQLATSLSRHGHLLPLTLQSLSSSLTLTRPAGSC